MIIPPTDPRAIQRSPEWFAWRRGDDLGDGPRITASEIGIILGISPYKTAHRLWLEKTGQADPPPPNWGQQRGIDLEDTARLAYVRKTGNLVEPVWHNTHCLRSLYRADVSRKVRALDLEARGAQRVETVPEVVMDDALARLQAIFE